MAMRAGARCLTVIGGAARPERLALGQGGYYLITGVWPLIHMGSFEAVTGPKTDRWLVKTVGVVVAVVGAVLALAGVRRRVTLEITLLAAGSAGGLGLIDFVYGGSGRISRIYLLDALVEAVLVAQWARARGVERRRTWWRRG
ncbi:MAG: hypothetical protein U0531_06255 [Dehalococcoidia bacterium]